MKNEKKLVAFMVLVMLFGINYQALAAQGGQGGTGTPGSGQGAQANMADINKNGVGDGTEDFDNDGILNKNDADYQKSYLNAKDSDGDGVINKNDTDYVQPLDGTGLRAKNASSTSGAARKSITQNKKQSLQKRVSGRIIIKPEDKGKAFYVNPASGKVSSLGRPAEAFAVIKKEGIGVSNADFTSWNGVAPASMAGKIVLKVEDKGQAYYVNPDSLKLVYLNRPADAFRIMKEVGLGISNSDFSSLVE